MDWFITQCDQLRAMFRAFFPATVTDAIMSLARPALRLSSGPAEARSRLGGPPVLPAGTPWPMWGDRPLDFVGVIDFGELASEGWLPELTGVGSTAFYYATGLPRPWGDDPTQTAGWRVLPGARVPAGPVTLPEVRLGASPFVSLPSPHEPVLEPIGAAAAGFTATYPELYASWARFTWGDAPRHQTGGCFSNSTPMTGSAGAGVSGGVSTSPHVPPTYGPAPATAPGSSCRPPHSPRPAPRVRPFDAP